jgi:alpha-1,3-glucosyltransferase
MVFLCGCIFFLFGFHVHEKAITPYIGLLIVFLSSDEENKGFLDCAIFVNIISLLPLLISPNEKILRIALPLLWISIW